MRYAIEKTLEDPSTGVESSFHLLTGYTVSYPSYVTVTISTYFNKKGFESGKQPISSTNVQILNMTLPIEGNIEKVLVEKLIVAEPSNDSWYQDVDRFTGGKVVEIE